MTRGFFNTLLDVEKAIIFFADIFNPLAVPENVKYQDGWNNFLVTFWTQTSQMYPRALYKVVNSDVVCSNKFLKLEQKPDVEFLFFLNKIDFTT